jgi:hypothetical protein
MDDIREKVLYKLRQTAIECGQKAITPAIIVGPFDLESPISGHQYIRCATLGDVTLGNVDWKTARYFEDVW